MSREPPQGQPYSAWQARLAEVSRPWLLRLHAMPRAVVLLVTLAMAAAGLFLPGAAGGVFLILLGMLVLWLALLTWSTAGGGGRALRLGTSAVILAYGIAKAIGAA